MRVLSTPRETQTLSLNSFSLVLYCNFSFYNGGTAHSQFAYVDQHAVSLLVTAVVANPAYPSGRIEMHVNRLAGIMLLDEVSNPFRRLSVFALVASGIVLHTLAIHLISALHHLLVCINRFGRFCGITMMLLDASLRCFPGESVPLIIVVLFLLGILSAVLCSHRLWCVALAVHQFVNVLTLVNDHSALSRFCFLLHTLGKCLCRDIENGQMRERENKNDHDAHLLSVDLMF